MVAKAGSPPVITGERKKQLSEFTDMIDADLECQQGTTKMVDLHQFHSGGLSEVLFYKRWMNPEIIRLYKEEGGWKYVEIARYERPNGNISMGLYLSCTRPRVVSIFTLFQNVAITLRERLAI